MLFSIPLRPGDQGPGDQGTRGQRPPRTRGPGGHGPVPPSDQETRGQRPPQTRGPGADVPLGPGDKGPGDKGLASPSDQGTRGQHPIGPGDQGPTSPHNTWFISSLLQVRRSAGDAVLLSLTLSPHVMCGCSSITQHPDLRGTAAGLGLGCRGVTSAICLAPGSAQDVHNNL